MSSSKCTPRQPNVLNINNDNYSTLFKRCHSSKYFIRFEFFDAKKGPRHFSNSAKLMSSRGSAQMKYSSSFFTRIYRNLNMLFERHLFLTNQVVTLSMLLSADVIAQVIEQKYFTGNEDTETHYDVTRTLRVGATCVAIGPWTHYWYRFLDSVFPGRQLRIVLIKTCLDVLVYAPVFLVSFFGIVGLLEEGNLSKLKTELADSGLTVYAVDCVCAFPVQMFNFLVLPPRYRAAYAMTYSMCIDIFMTFVRHYNENMELRGDQRISFFGMKS